MGHPRLRRAVLTIFAVLPSVPAVLEAQQITSPYRYIERAQEVGAFTGYLDVDEGRFGLGPKPAPFFGLRYGIQLGGPVGIEARAATMPTERDVVSPTLPEGERVLADPAEVNLVFVDARLRFGLTGRRTWHGFQPFALLGLGVVFDSEGDQLEDQELEDDARVDMGTEFQGAFGAGTRLFLTERLILRGEVGLTLYRLDIPDAWRDPSLDFEAVPETQWVSGSTFSIGAAVLF